MKSSYQQSRRTKRSTSTDQTESTPVLSEGNPPVLTSEDQQSKPSAETESGSNSTQSMKPKSAPTLTDDNRQHAAILRAAAIQLAASGLCRLMLSEKTNTVRLVFDRDLWTEKLELR